MIIGIIVKIKNKMPWHPSIIGAYGPVVEIDHTKTCPYLVSLGSVKRWFQLSDLD
jgi:hypothetical protein